MGPGTFKMMFLGLMASGLPVAFAMAGASLIYVLVSGNEPPYVVVHRMFGGHMLSVVLMYFIVASPGRAGSATSSPSVSSRAGGA